MGMFDYVKVDVLLPDGYTGNDFQTKDFDCYLERYEIRPDGTLWKRDGQYADPEQVRFHGVFNFYDYGSDNNWHSYDAKFTNGILEEITMKYDHWRMHQPPKEDEND